jgi:hypothetical protein
MSVDKLAIKTGADVVRLRKRKEQFAAPTERESIE